MGCATGEAKEPPLRPIFDRRIKLEFHGARITSDGGLLAYRELDDALGLTDIAITKLLDGRRGKNTRHKLSGLFRQSVFGRLAGYEDVNDAERLARDPAMRAIVGREGLERLAASSSQIGRFETEWLANEANLAALMDLPGAWIDQVHERKPPEGIILDMDSSESPTHGEQEGSAYNGHFGCTCYHPLFVFNQFGDLERCLLRAGHVHSAEDWRLVLEPVIARYRERGVDLYFRADAAFAKPEIYEFLEGEGIRYAIRLPANQVLQRRIEHLLTRPVGRPPKKPIVSYASFRYQAKGWTQARRVVAKVEWHQGELYPRVGFIVTNLTRPQRAGGEVLQRPRHRRAVDQGRQERAPLDAAVLPCLPAQRGAAPAPRARLQPRQLPAHAWPCPRRSSIGRSRPCARSWSRSAPASCAMAATWCSSWPRWQCRAPCSPRSCIGSIGLRPRPPPLTA